jgi:predicted ribosomally synthesized peptide with nif11-like leader
MSEVQLNAFLKAVEGDATLEQRLNSAADFDAVVALSREAGFVLSNAEVQTLQEMSEGLGDEELALAVGGNWFSKIFKKSSKPQPKPASNSSSKVSLNNTLMIGLDAG